MIVLSDRILVAGPTQLSVFADETAVRERLARRRAESPDDYAPLLTLAQLDFLTGDTAAVEAQLREAAELPGGRGPAVQSALALAGSASDAAAVALLRAAVDIARQPADRANAAFALADRLSDPSQRLAIYQGVLADAALRRVMLAAAGRTEQAAVTAERAIAAILEEHGRNLYAAYEAEAAAALAEATTADALAAVASSFPNAEAAGAARAQIADRAVAAGDMTAARPALRQLRLDRLAGNDPEGAADALLRLARLELAADADLDLAAGRFARLAREWPDAPAGTVELPGGERLENLHVAQVAAALRQRVAERDAAAVPSLFDADAPERPLAAVASATLADTAALLPVAAGGPLAVVSGDGALSVLSPNTLEAELNVAAPPIAPAAIERLNDGGFLIWGDDGAARLDAAGSTLWRVGFDSVASATRVQAAPLPTAGDGSIGPEFRKLEAQLSRVDFRTRDDGDAEQARQAIAQLRNAARSGTLVVEDRGDGDVRFSAREGRVRLNVLGDDAAVLEMRPNFTARFGVFRPAVSVSIDTAAAAQDGFGVIAASPAREGLLLLVRPDSEGDPLLLAFVARDGGEVRWVHPLAKSVAAQVSAAGDYAVVRLLAGGDGSDQSQLVAIDLDSGRRVMSRPFESAGDAALLNVLPLASNELILVRPRSLDRLDLDEAAAVGDWDDRNADQSTPVRYVAAQVDPLVTYADAASRWLGDGTGGRIRIVGDSLLLMSDPRQTGRLDAAVLDLETLRPREIEDPRTGEPHELLLLGGEADAAETDLDALPPHQRDREVRQRVRAEAGVLAPAAAGDLPASRIWADGTRVYLAGRRGLSGYDLAAPDGTVGPHWWRDDDLFAREFDPATNLDLLLSRELAVLVDAPLPGLNAQPVVRFTPFSRATVAGKGYESGLMLAPLALPGGVSDWRLTEAGLVVLDEAGDLRLYPAASAD